MRWDDTSEFTLVEPGNYVVRVDEACVGQSSAGKVVLHCHFRVVGTPFDGTLIKKSLPNWLVCVLAKALKMEPTVNADGERFYELDARDIVGRLFRVSVGHREYQGNQYNELGRDFVIAETAPTGEDIPF
jgi:hypothetical protein